MAEGRLDLHEAFSDPAAGSCPRWPETMRLRNLGTGELVRGRCRATNLCDYCARLFAVETAELLALDALTNSAPLVWVVLTTRSGDTDPATFYRAREQFIKALRRRWPEVEYAGLVEFTTGYGPRSGGVRRPHWNLLLKGVRVEDIPAIEAVVAKVWCGRVDAEPWAQHVSSVDEVGGLLRYITLHFLKASQMPPRGWKGHRFLVSRGYFGGSTRGELRPAARRSLQFGREVWKLHRADPSLDANALDLLARAQVERLAEASWRLVWIDPAGAEAPAAGRAAVDRAREPALARSYSER